jgi:hypothetical protein
MCFVEIQTRPVGRLVINWIPCPALSGPWKGFERRALDVGFVLGSVALGQVFHAVLRSPPPCRLFNPYLLTLILLLSTCNLSTGPLKKSAHKTGNVRIT